MSITKESGSTGSGELQVELRLVCDENNVKSGVYTFGSLNQTMEEFLIEIRDFVSIKFKKPHTIQYYDSNIVWFCFLLFCFFFFFNTQTQTQKHTHKN